MNFSLLSLAVFISVFLRLIATPPPKLFDTRYRSCGINNFSQTSLFSKEKTELKGLDVSYYSSREAKRHEWPWAVSLGTFDLVNSPFYQPRCSGVLITEQWVLTSASCLRALKSGPNLLPVAVVGAHNISSFADFEPSKQVVPLMWQIPHPAYRHNPIYDPPENDIALVQLDYPLEMKPDSPDSPDSPHLWTVCLPEQADTTAATNPYVNKSGTFYGWGERQPKFEVMSDVLSVIDLHVISCEPAVSYEISYNHVACIIGRFNGFCEGDIGGPLMVKDSFSDIDQWTVVAVAISPGHCAIEGLTSYLTMVSPYVNWIWQTITSKSLG